MKVSILTLFPEMFRGPFSESILRILQDKKIAEIKIINIRDFGIGRHKVVDDKPYGGGKGMLLRVDVIHKTIETSRHPKLKNKEKVILMGPKGKTFNQALASEYSRLKHLIIVCGHYEGLDDRIRDYVDEEVSIGDFIVTGGEIPAMLVTDSVLRLVEGSLHPQVTQEESFSRLTKTGGLQLEHPQFTRPRTYKGRSVPDVLLSGNHAVISDWKKKKSKEITRKARPDLLFKKAARTK